MLVVASFVLTPVAAAQSTTNTTLKASFLLSFGDRIPCKGEAVTAKDTSMGDVESRSWRLNDMAANAYGSGPEITFTLDAVGSYTLSLTVTNRSGATSDYSRTWSSKDCSATASSPSASPAPGGTDCYTYEYKDEYGTVHRETKCPTGTPAPYPTQPAASGECQALMEERQKYESDWKYRYYAHYQESGTEPGSDPAFDEAMHNEMADWADAWKQRWIAAGCEGTAGECREKIEAAKAEFESLRSKYQALWDEYYQRLESARREFAGQGYHTDAEWKEFEAKWRAEADALRMRFEEDAKAIFARHPGLRECGFYYEFFGGQPDYQKDYGSAAPTDPYAAARRACEERMIKAKEAFAARFEELHKQLAAAAEGSDEYLTIKQQLADLEAQVRAEMERIAAECREAYKASYDAPDSFKDREGSLVCYFDDAAKEVRCAGKYVSFTGNPDTQVISSYTCGGQLYLDQLWANKVFEDFQFGESDGASQLAIRSGGLKLIFHDGPRGVINIGLVDGAEVYIAPNSLFQVRVDGNKVILDGPDADGAFLGGEGALAWDAVKRVLTVRGEATWVAESCIPTGDKPDGGDDAKFWDSIHRRRLGAQITIALTDGAVDHDDETYHEGMDVAVEKEAGRNKFTAKVDSDEDCKTVVLKFDRDIFETIKLRIQLSDDMGNAIEILKADSLEDVLDPCGAGEEDAFEYWVVLDELGTQVIVSFAHFSEKRVTVEAASNQQIMVPGFGLDLAVLGAAVAAAALLAARRRLSP